MYVNTCTFYSEEAKISNILLYQKITLILDQVSKVKKAAKELHVQIFK